jgi:hypothetical protein
MFSLQSGALNIPVFSTGTSTGFPQFIHSSFNRLSPRADSDPSRDHTRCCDGTPAADFMFGAKPGSIDAALYGFMANIYFYEIDMPLKQVLTSKENLVAHCR